jgi:hypothetical protein
VGGGYVLLVTIWGIFHFLLLSFIAVIAGVALKVPMNERGMLPVRQAKYLLWLYTVIVALSLVVASYYYAPGPMFRRHVMDPVPTSVKILDAQHYGQRDASAYIHFTASPEDIENLVQAGGYKLIGPIKQPTRQPHTLDDERPLPDMLYAHWPRPAWFTPSKFPDMIQYVRRHRDSDTYDLFYSPSTGQAYYTWLNF